MFESKCKKCGKIVRTHWKRKFCSAECREKSKEIREGRKKRMIGPKNPMWKGGDSDKDRRNSAYKTWRIEVFKRDGFKCQQCNYFNGCGEKRKDLNAHHIVAWVDSVELRYEVANGLTLCVSCHIKEHTNKA